MTNILKKKTINFCQLNCTFIGSKLFQCYKPWIRNIAFNKWPIRFFFSVLSGHSLKCPRKILLQLGDNVAECVASDVQCRLVMIGRPVNSIDAKV